MTSEERAVWVKQRAAALGFDACGIAAAGNVDSEDRLGSWLARGFHADLHWMARTKKVRQDARLRLPGARSVVVVARNYYAERPKAAPGTGLVSRYAWGRDYHRVLRKPVSALARSVAELERGAQCYVCIDSGPVLERAWAAQAGVGWIGKNGLVIRSDMGSWFFLGALLTTVELAPDHVAADRCGSCERCVRACPTGAIVEPKVVDARLCISYQTIENRGEIPAALRPRVGRWLCGCDVCQEACPWNRFAQETSESGFRPREGCANPDVEAWCVTDEATFNRDFAGTPIRRVTYSGMQRNLRIVRENLDRGRMDPVR
jgi:epoxyqueuosine reductase